MAVLACGVRHETNAVRAWALHPARDRERIWLARRASRLSLAGAVHLEFDTDLDYRYRRDGPAAHLQAWTALAHDPGTSVAGDRGSQPRTGLPRASHELWPT